MTALSLIGALASSMAVELCRQRQEPLAELGDETRGLAETPHRRSCMGLPLA